MISRKSVRHYKSGWAIKVAKVLSEAAIPFYYEPVKFFLPGNIVYTPDFLLSRSRISGRNVVLEPHGLMENRDIRKFSLFRQRYGTDFFLVLLVRNDTIPSIPTETYDLIWPMEYADLLMKRIKERWLQSILND